MSAFLNAFSNSWLSFFSIAFIQNSVFLIIIFLLLFIFRKQDPRLLQGLTRIALLKLLLPPFLSFPIFSDNILGQTLYLPEIIIHPGLFPDTNSGFSVSSIVFLFWFIPALIFLIVFLTQYFYFKTKFRNIQRIDSLLLPHIPNRIHIYNSRAQHSPFVFGLLHPKIVLPANWNSWDKTHLNIVLQHEIRHIRQGDIWLNLFGMIVFTIHFYNPLVWILLKKSTLYNEITCDNAAIFKNSLNRKNYSKQLLNLAKLSSGTPQAVTFLPFSKTHQMIKQRILYQLTAKEKTSMKKLSMASISILATAVLLMIPFSTDIQSAGIMGSGFTSADSTFEFFAVDQKPVIIHKGTPSYPEIARKSGTQGVVVVTVTVDSKGNVISAKIFKSVNGLDKAAKEAALKCKFKPAKHNGKLVNVKMNIPFSFKLQ